MIVRVLLAAGRGSRFGSQKLLAQLPDGRAVVEAAAITLQKKSERTIAVVADEGEVAALLRRVGCEIVINPRAPEGMGTSIAAGAAASRDAAGWLIALGDMPYVQPDTITQVHDRLASTGGIVIPSVETRRGHPVGFAARYFDELIALCGDEGARKIVAAHRDAVHLLPVQDHGIVADIDRPEDIRR